METMETVSSAMPAASGRDDDRAWQRRLRQFSGKSSCPAGELDYDAWTFHVEQLIQRPDIAEEVKRQFILQNLVQPVLGLVRSLGNTPSVSQIVNVISVVYGPPLDGHGLLVKFYDCVQLVDETALLYLQRLQRLLRRVVDSGALAEEGEFPNLRRQFCRGCGDEPLILALGLESSPARFSSFCELLAGVHAEECRRHDKAVRLGRREVLPPRARGKTNAVACSASDVAGSHTSASDAGLSVAKVVADAFATHTDAILKGIAALHHTPRVVSPGKKDSRLCGPRPSAHSEKPPVHRRQPAQVSRRVVFCYHCGLDGHMQRECDQSPNATLVHKRLQERAGSAVARNDGKSRSHLN